MRTTQLIFAFALALLGATATSAQEFHYDLEGRFGWFGQKFDSTLSLTKREDGRYDVVRSWSYEKDGSAPRLTGIADVVVRHERVGRSSGRKSTVTIKAVFTTKKGATDAIASIGGTSSGEDADTTTGNYRVRGNEISGWVQVKGRDGSIKRVYETGRRTKTPIDYGDYDVATNTATPGTGLSPASGEGDANATGEDGVADVGSADPVLEGLTGNLDRALKILQPQPGVYLAGQKTPIVIEGAEIKDLVVVAGDAKISRGELRLNGPGQVRLQLKSGGSVSYPVNLEVVEAEITKIVVLDTITIADAKPPHLQRDLGSDHETYAWEPAAILQDTQLQLRVTLKAPKSLTNPVKVRLVATEADLELEEQVVLQDLAGGQELELISTGSLTESIQVNTLDLEWEVHTERNSKQGTSLNTTPLRIYTVYGQPVDNPLPRYGPTQRQGPLALNTKLHYELVCDWAKGATRNIGNGNDSIAYNIDNQMRHHVAWKDYQGNVPKIPHYPEGQEPPLNYSLIPGYVQNGTRGVSSLYYPSADATREVEQYEHYRNNFGWWVLDNPQYAGGRCNQQASLICDLVGTIGMEAEVYYIERVARGKVSGRPIRRYYRSSRSSKSWNFHGQAKVRLEDGTFWLYDGSGSSPPRRINGKLEELMAIPGPYIKYWEAWRYEDGNRAFAPASEWPSTWRGVPLQEGEEALDPNAPDGTYFYRVGRGTMDDTGSEAEHHGKGLTFYAVFVGGQFVFKVGEGKPEAETYNSAVHGGFTKWIGG